MLNQPEAIAEAQKLLANFIAPTDEQKTYLEEAFNSLSSMQVCAINSLVDPGSRNNVCQKLNNKGIKICSTLQEAQNACVIGSKEIKNQWTSYVQDKDLSFIPSIQ